MAGRSYPVADAHVDVLYRMVNDHHAFYGVQSPLQASADKLRAGGVLTQVFALYVSAHYPSVVQLDEVLRGIDTFYNEVVQPGVVNPVRNLRELANARSQGALAGILSLEGGGCLSGRASLLRVLFRLGVRGIGLTWNPANELADGCGEPRGGGLTGAGREVVKEAERLGMWVDLAHLADQGAAQVLATCDGPVMASHANCRAVHEHPRNLTDDTIRALIRRQGWMGLVFEGSFVSAPETASVAGVLNHLDHVLELGGEDIVGLGSDFDGTSTPVAGLKDARDYSDFSQLLVDRYGEATAKKILFDNFEQFLKRSLPK